MSAPKTTQIIPKKLPASLIALIEVGKFPPTITLYTFGKSEIMLAAAFKDLPWYMTITRMDRMPTEQEIRLVCGFLIPAGTRVVISLGSERTGDGRYVAQIFGEKDKEAPKVERVGPPQFFIEWQKRHARRANLGRAFKANGK